MQVYDNSPSSGYISWTGLHITYKGVTYNLPDANTNYVYVWWDYSSPNALQVSNTYPALTDDDVIVFLNKSGIHATVPNTTVIDGSLIVPESILTNALAANSVTSTQIAANAVTSDTVAANAIVAGKIATNAVTAGTIAASAVTTGTIAANAVGASAIAANVITADKLYLGGAVSDIAANKPVISSTGVIVSNGGGNYSNNNALGYWQFSGTNPTLTIDLGASIPQITRVTFGTYFDGDTHYIPNGVTVDFSTDNSTWTNVSTITANTGTSISFQPSSSTARYIRITVTAYQSGQTLSNIANFHVLSQQGSTMIQGGNIVANSITADRLAANTITAASGVIASIDAGKITTGTLDASKITVSNLSASVLITGTLDASKVSVTNLDAASISTGTLNFSRLPSDTQTAITNANNWVTPSTTTIDGSHVTTGTITAKQISIGDFVNLADVDEINGVTTSSQWSTSAISSGWNTFATVGGNTVDVMFSNQKHPLPFEPNDTVYFQFNAIATTSVTATFQVWVFSTTSSGDGISQQSTSFTIGTTESTISGTVKIPSYTRNARQSYIVGINASSNPFTAGVKVRNVRVNRMTGGSLIVDGSITATEIQSGSLTTASGVFGDINASSITSGTINAARIAADSITTDKIAIGDFNNYCANGDFETDISGGTAKYWAGLQVVDNPTKTTGTGSYRNYSNKVATIPSQSSGNADRWMNTPLIPVSMGDSFAGSFDVKWGNTSQQGNVAILLRGFDANGNGLSYWPQVATTSVKEDWAHFDGTVNLSGAPSNIAYVQIGVSWQGSNNSGGNIYIDNIIVRRALTGSLFVDGNISGVNITGSSFHQTVGSSNIWLDGNGFHYNSPNTGVGSNPVDVWMNQYYPLQASGNNGTTTIYDGSIGVDNGTTMSLGIDYSGLNVGSGYGQAYIALVNGVYEFRTDDGSNASIIDPSRILSGGSFSFSGDGAYDTGLLWLSDGNFNIQSNGSWRLGIHPDRVDMGNTVPVNISTTLSVQNTKLNGQHSIQSLDGGRMYITDGAGNNTDLTVRSLTQSSRIELKQDIRVVDTQESLSRILSTDILNYNFKSDIAKGVDNPHIGFVIGGHYKLPDLYVDPNREGIKDYDCIGDLFGAVQQIVKTYDKEISKLEQEVYVEKCAKNSMLLKIAYLEQRLIALEKS